MKIRKIALFIVPFILSGCSFDFFGLFKKQNDEKKETNKEDNAKYTSVKLLDKLTEDTIPFGSQLDQESGYNAMMTYWDSKEQGLVTSCDIYKVGVPRLDTGYAYLTVGTSSYEGEITFHFSKEISKLDISIAGWYKYNSTDQVYNIDEAKADVTFAGSTTTFNCQDRDDQADVVTKTLKGSSPSNSLKIESKTVNGKMRAVVRSLTVYYK